ncbi:hypothetical protein [Delftia sp. ZNC0008]|uniref:hypothetical protein n=1 Tax=Delftia sp. ZNC0008 TaxID=1339242 RepID=UPI0012DFF611|nr:hypothetical protein [Delftia sp. ZNC0008]
MESTIITAGIAAVAAVAGGAIAAFASHLNTRHRVRELELIASHKLREHYLQNAREYTKGIYIPLSLVISDISDAHNSFQRNPATAGATDSFRIAIDEFTRKIKQLRDSGAEAFLTNELEERLRSFTDFLHASRDATTLSRKAEIGYRVGLGGVTWAETSAFSLNGGSAIWWRSPKMSISLPGVGVTYEAKVIKHAPLESAEFAKRFSGDTGEIRYLIKEVTLGGKPREALSK